MRIAPDTNVFIRALTGDEPQQSRIAEAELANAELVAIAMPVLCEVVWVLSRVYGFASLRIAAAIRRMTDAANVVVNRPALEAGLASLESGGDFADGAIAYEGRWLGAEVFVSFDRKAVQLLEAQGESARVL